MSELHDMIRYWLEEQGGKLAAIQPGGNGFPLKDDYSIGAWCEAYLDFDEEHAYLLSIYTNGVQEHVAVYWRPMDDDHLDVERMTFPDSTWGDKLMRFGEWVDDVRRLART
jgi:hypothetical protein